MVCFILILPSKGPKRWLGTTIRTPKTQIIFFKIKADSFVQQMTPPSFSVQIPLLLNMHVNMHLDLVRRRKGEKVICTRNKRHSLPFKTQAYIFIFDIFLLSWGRGSTVKACTWKKEMKANVLRTPRFQTVSRDHLMQNNLRKTEKRLYSSHDSGNKKVKLQFPLNLQAQAAQVCMHGQSKANCEHPFSSHLRLKTTFRNVWD